MLNARRRIRYAHHVPRALALGLMLISLVATGCGSSSEVLGVDASNEASNVAQDLIDSMNRAAGVTVVERRGTNADITVVRASQVKESESGVEAFPLATDPIVLVLPAGDPRGVVDALGAGMPGLRIALPTETGDEAAAVALTLKYLSTQYGPAWLRSIRRNAVRYGTGESVAIAVASGQADAGFSAASNALRGSAGVNLVSIAPGQATGVRYVAKVKSDKAQSTRIKDLREKIDRARSLLVALGLIPS